MTRIKCDSFSLVREKLVLLVSKVLSPETAIVSTRSQGSLMKYYGGNVIMDLHLIQEGGLVILLVTAR